MPQPNGKAYTELLDEICDSFATADALADTPHIHLSKAMKHCYAPLRKAFVRLLTVAVVLTSARAATATVTLGTVHAVEKIDSSVSPSKVSVDIVYNITKVPLSGVTLDLTANLSDADGNVLLVTPLAEEMTGDVGTVLTDGDKKIHWDAEKTLTRLAKQGVYTAKIDLKVEGTSGATQAHLAVNSYKPAGWYYFATGDCIIRDLVQISQLPDAGCASRGGGWESTVEAGATLYKGNCTQIPVWKGRHQNDAITGTLDAGSCDAFVAVKKQGTSSEKVWINFSRHFKGALDINGTHKDIDWEYQFRYTRDKTAATETLQAGNAGSPTDNSFALWNEGKDMLFTLEAAPDAEAKSNDFDLEVVRHEYRYSYKGAPIFVFKTTGDSYFVGNNITNGLQLKSITGTPALTVNGWLNFKGSFTIDTSVDLGSFRSNGEWTNHNGLSLSSFPLDANLTTKIEVKNVGGGVFNPNKSLNIGGFSLTFENIQFTGGADKAGGIKFDVRLIVNQLSSGCAFDIKKDNPLLPNPGGSANAGFKLNGVSLTDDGWDLTGVEAQNVGMTIAPVFCLKSFKANYDRKADSLFAELLVKGPIFDEIGGSFAIVKQEIDAYRVSMKLGGGGIGEISVPIPYPPPPANIAEWRGFDVAVSNLRNGPLTLDGKMLFANNSAWKDFAYFKNILDKISIVPGINLNDVKLFEFDGGGKYVHGQSFELKTTFRLWQIYKDTWLQQGDASLLFAVNPGFSVTASGTNRLFNFGGDSKLAENWVFAGAGSMGLTGTPELAVSGSLSGASNIPALFKNNPVFVAINDWFALPWHLEQVTLTMNNLAFSFTMDVPRIGKVTVKIDGSRNPFTDYANFIQIAYADAVSNTRLHPSGPNGIQAVGDTTWHQFSVTSNMQRIFAQNWGTTAGHAGGTAASSSVLVSPNGTVYSATASDSSVIFYSPVSLGHSAMWVIRSPIVGGWKLGVIDKGNTDSISTWATFKAPSDFRMFASEQNRNVTALWTPSGASGDSKVSIYLSTDSNKFAGQYIGSVAESAGKYSYQLTDSLASCGYYIYGTRNIDGVLSASYALDASKPEAGPVHLDNSKSWLAAPTNIRGEVNAHNLATVLWDSSADAHALTYVVHVVDQSGFDSVYAERNFNYSMAQFQLDNWTGKRVYIQTLGEGDVRGCPSNSVGFVLNGVAERPSADGPSALTLYVAPQPVTDHSTIYTNLSRNAQLIIELYDVTGRKLQVLKQGQFEAGTVRTDLNVGELPNGVYIVRANGDGFTASQSIVVKK